MVATRNKADWLAGDDKARGSTAVMAARDRASDDVDFFPTPPWGARAGAELVKQLDPEAVSVWECAAGAGHLVHGLRDYFAQVHASDAYDYGLGHRIFDFVDGGHAAGPFAADWIISNPPFAHINEFWRLAYARAGRGVAMLMRLAILEGQGRYPLFYKAAPLTVVAPFSERLPMMKARWDAEKTTATAYAWFIAIKGQRPGRGKVATPLIMPIAPGARARLTRPSDTRFAVQWDGEAA